MNKLQEIKKALNEKYYEGEDEIEGMLVALLSRQHVFLVGEPGTGKSLLSMELAKVIDGGKYFQWLLTKYTTPEELFGALEIKELEKGVHKRNTSGKLPEAELVFLDEVFKSNSAILNSLLTLINERLFYNNGTPVKSPLISLITASNELPEEDEGLEALYDRLLLRYEVKSIKERDNYISMLKSEKEQITVPSLTLDELIDLQFYTSMVSVPDEIYEKVADIVEHLQDEAIYPSARRVKNSIGAIKAKAFIHGRNTVEDSDLFILSNILWDRFEEIETVKDIVRHFAQDHIKNELENISTTAKELMLEIDVKKKDNKLNYEDCIETAKKLDNLVMALIELKKDYSERESEIDPVRDMINKMKKEVTDAVLEPIPTSD